MEKTSTVEFKVKLRFTGEYPEAHLDELARNVADALYEKYGGSGIVPDEIVPEDDELFTEGAVIRYGDKALVDNYYDSHIKGRYTHTLDFPE